MKVLVNVLATVIAIAILSALVYGLYLGGGYLWARLGELHTAVRTALLTGMATVLLGSLIIAAGLRAAARSIAQGRLSGDKLALYRALLHHHRTALGAPGAHQQVPGDLGLELGLLGSVSVIEAHARLCAGLIEPASSPRPSQDGLADLLKAMRRDLGYAQALDMGKVAQLVPMRPGPVHDRHLTDVPEPPQ